MSFRVLEFVFIAFVTTSVQAAAVKEVEDGVYSQALKVNKYDKLLYIVDTKVQQCYVGGISNTILPCEILIKRNEWKAVITWIK